MKIIFMGRKIKMDLDLLEQSREEVVKQIEQFEAGRRKEFELDIFYPNNFTGQVMKEMSRIEHGDSQTYGEIAERLGSAPIAVGQACGRNPLPIIVPCHRVVGAHSLGGYAYGLEFKKKLLDFESKSSKHSL